MLCTRNNANILVALYHFLGFLNPFYRPTLTVVSAAMHYMVSILFFSLVFAAVLMSFLGQRFTLLCRPHFASSDSSISAGNTYALHANLFIVIPMLGVDFLRSLINYQFVYYASLFMSIPLMTLPSVYQTIYGLSGDYAIAIRSATA